MEQTKTVRVTLHDTEWEELRVLSARKLIPLRALLGRYLKDALSKEKP